RSLPGHRRIPAPGAKVRQPRQASDRSRPLAGPSSRATGGIRSTEKRELSTLANSNLGTRLLTAAIGAPLILLLLYLGPPWGWFLFVAVAAVVAAVEFFGMTHPSDRPSQIAGVAFCVAIMAVLWQWSGEPKVLVATLVLLPTLALCSVLWRLGDMR